MYFLLSIIYWLEIMKIEKCENKNRKGRRRGSLQLAEAYTRIDIETKAARISVAGRKGWTYANTVGRRYILTTNSETIAEYKKASFL